MVFTFGKYADYPLEEIESTYLCYALDTFKIPDLLRRQCRAELVRRYGIEHATINGAVESMGDLRLRIKQTYRELALKHHPDRPGGTHAAMLAINEFNQALSE